MKVLDTDTLTHLFQRHPRVVARRQLETEEIATTIVSRIEILQGRFSTLLKAADGSELQCAQQWLDETLENLAKIPKLLVVDAASANEFDRLRANKKLKKIGRADLLIAAITLANKATLVTRNEKGFRQVPGLTIVNWVD